MAEDKTRKGTEDHKNQRLAILKRLYRGDENELERKLRLETATKTAQETDEARKTSLEMGTIFLVMLCGYCQHSGKCHKKVKLLPRP